MEIGGDRSSDEEMEPTRCSCSKHLYFVVIRKFPVSEPRNGERAWTQHRNHKRRNDAMNTAIGCLRRKMDSIEALAIIDIVECRLITQMTN